MIGLGDPERIVIDCAGDEWYVRGPDGAVRSTAAPADVEEFVAPAVATRQWAQWLADAAGGSAPSRTWTVLAPSVFGAPRRSLIAAAAAALGVDADVLPRAAALADAAGVLFCRRALVLECRGAVAQAHVLVLADGAWRPVAAASHPDPVRAARRVVDDEVDQAIVDGPPEVYRAVRAALATVHLWRVVRTDPADVLALGPDGPPAAEPRPPDPEPEPAAAHRRPRRWPLVVAGAGTVGLVAAGAVACLPGAPPAAPVRPAPPDETFVRVAFDGASVDLPRGWAVSEPGPDRRLAQADDGRRVTVVRTRLRAPSDLAAVAADLESALARRADRRITDLTPSTLVAGREVIGYRERLDAERFVDWYVVVAGTAQLSVGCEAGRTAAPLAGACERAVGTVREE
ncbi:type VII secretion-associated protein [Tsukamurella paurometabola]|uniref:Type VII secretion-associated protein, Rv3446c family n=1 Tax=Tsukamurella paurometabola TaxID=2061 RepID=A0A3P8LF37_TSUPA|nr:type VII secretion-associated protein [Tsukamurella paurometabola]UEA82334.1 type VII secretion-associated protein [Tsukamurella paurometabola]VDR39382.1 type VII secretion-associated protein, Rv3446c family [Tsukamurella paurometabola]